MKDICIDMKNTHTGMMESIPINAKNMSSDTKDTPIGTKSISNEHEGNHCQLCTFRHRRKRAPPAPCIFHDFPINLGPQICDSRGPDV